MPISFESPVGSHIDVRELEYLAAIHQTGGTLRKRATIDAEDVVTFLASRHGIKADIDFVRERVMPSLAGAFGDNPEAVFDICEIACILLIPKLKEMATNQTQSDMQLFQRVADMIILDVTGSGLAEPRLNRSFMREVLETYGEEGVSDDVVDEMLQACGIDTNNTAEIEDGGPELNAAALMRATTHDLKQYNPSWSETATTHYDDVFDSEHNLEWATYAPAVIDRAIKRAKSKGDDEDKRSKAAQGKIAFHKVHRDFMFPTIDYVAENYRSKALTVWLWLVGILAFSLYAEVLPLNLGRVECQSFFASDFACQIVRATVSWFIVFVQLCVLGVSYFVLSSSSNSIYLQKGFFPLLSVLIGVAAVFTATILSYFKKVEIETMIIHIDTKNRDQEPFAYISVLAIGCLLILYHLKTLLYVLIPKWMFECLPGREFFVVSGIAIGERNTKRAANYKVNKMIESAIGHHDGTIYEDAVRMSARQRSSSHSAFGRALLHFQATSDEREWVGGIFWTYKKIWDGSMFSELGIWIHARLIASNLSQVAIAVFFIYMSAILINLINDVYDFIEELRSMAESAFEDIIQPILGALLLAGESFGSYDDDDGLAQAQGEASIGRRLLQSTTRFLQDSKQFQWKEILDVLPKRWEMLFTVSFGAFSAVFVLLSLAIIWLPSSVSTILQFRCGAIPSLRSAEFQGYREAPDLTSILFGSTFWGALYASLTVWFIASVLSVLLAWNLTRPILLLILAQVIGIVITVLVKELVVMVFRNFLFKGFFRKRPAGANFMLLVLECWSLGLTLGTVTGRFIKLLAVSIFYIGRIDTPLFAPGVGRIGQSEIDLYPQQFRKDLLLHEAHRHPYMERLCVMYMMKLRHGDAFASRAGSAWRLMFVMALMPWLRHYRVEEDEHDEDDIYDVIKKQVAKDYELSRPGAKGGSMFSNNNGEATQHQYQYQYGSFETREIF